MWCNATKQIIKNGWNLQPIKMDGKYEFSITYKTKNDFSLIINRKDGGSVWVEKHWTF